MPNIQVRFTGKKGEVDGYVETLIGVLFMSGQLIEPPIWNKRYRDNDLVQIYVSLKVKKPPLGNVGEKDIPENPFPIGELE